MLTTSNKYPEFCSFMGFKNVKTSHSYLSTSLFVERETKIPLGFGWFLGGFIQ